MNITASSSHTAICVRLPTTLALMKYSALWMSTRKPRHASAVAGETDSPTSVITTLHSRLPTIGTSPATKVRVMSAGV